MNQSSNPAPQGIDAPTSPNPARLSRWVLLGGFILAAAGASYAPWVYRPPAALILTAPDLAEFVKFLPDVRDGSLAMHRLLFLLPLFVATFGLPLMVMARRLAYPRWVRWPILAMVIPLALTLLPPVWSPGVLLSPEFRLQTLACLVCLALCASSRWLGVVPAGPMLLVSIPISLAAPILALWQFFVARPSIARAYASPIVPGWGAWLTMIGFALVALGALLSLRRLRVPTAPHASQR
jgi:hypothetical protein